MTRSSVCAAGEGKEIHFCKSVKSGQLEKVSFLFQMDHVRFFGSNNGFFWRPPTYLGYLYAQKLILFFELIERTIK